MSKFQPYHKPNVSRLEQWIDEITEMRTLNWPYPEIVKWLLEQHQLEITSEAIRQFCNLRSIIKGANPKQKSNSPKSHNVIHPAPKNPVKKFTYDSSKPIDIHKK